MPRWLYVTGLSIILIQICSNVLPVAAWAPRWAGLSRPMRYMAATTGLMMVADFVIAALAFAHVNNLWLIHLGTPVYATLTLLGLAWWQRSPGEARAFRIAATVFVVLWLAATARFEDIHRFSNLGRPLCALLICAGSGYTLLRRSQVADNPLTREGWFWICAGLLLLYATTVLLDPVSNILLDAKSNLIYVLHPTKSVFNIVANVLLMLGFRSDSNPRVPAELVLT